MVTQCIARAEQWLQSRTSWAPDQVSALARLAPVLLPHLPEDPPFLVGLGGPPGTGKSTLAGLLRHLWNSRHGSAPMVILSLDDYYLPRAERARLGARVHPLLARRGPPGTHDQALLFDHVDRLLAGATDPLALPRFDKGRDDRDGAPRRVSTNGRPAAVLLEGWFVGTPPQPESALASPANALEAREDPDGAWRRYVHRAHTTFHAQFERRAAATWHLAPPGWNEILAWRWAQERERPGNCRGLPDAAAVEEFLHPFERIARFQFDRRADWADLVVKLDSAHRPRLQSPA